MITAIIKQSEAGAYKGFDISGHALFSQAMKTEKDVVCASVSVLVINTINVLEELTDLGFSYEADENKGSITCSFEDNLNEKERFLLDAMVFGLENISKQYGKKFLRLEFEEV